MINVIKKLELDDEIKKCYSGIKPGKQYEACERGVQCA